MAKNENHYDFRIDAWAPDTLPMARLAEYLVQLSTLFGSREHVHFLKVKKGSAVPVMLVDETAKPKVESRLRLVGTPDAPQELTRAHDKINELLREDNASAYLRVQGGAKILEFKGARTPLSEEIVMFEHGDLDGVVIRIGGKDDSVPVQLEGEDGTFYRCNTKREIAKQLANHIFGNPVRVSGRGKWRRTRERDWELDVFDIQSFQALDATPLDQIVAELRMVEGSDWNNMENPQEELKKLRGD